jgi:hypothetical protein
VTAKAQWTLRVADDLGSSLAGREQARPAHPGQLLLVYSRPTVQPEIHIRPLPLVTSMHDWIPWDVGVHAWAGVCAEDDHLP